MTRLPIARKITDQRRYLVGNSSSFFGGLDSYLTLVSVAASVLKLFTSLNLVSFNETIAVWLVSRWKIRISLLYDFLSERYAYFREEYRFNYFYLTRYELILFRTGGNIIV